MNLSVSKEFSFYPRMKNNTNVRYNPSCNISHNFNLNKNCNIFLNLSLNHVYGKLTKMAHVQENE